MANTPKLPRNRAVGFIGWLGDLDLRCPAIHKEFDAGDEAAVIRGEKKDRLGNFFRRAGPPQRSRGGGLRRELLDLLIAQSKLRLVASCNDRSRTHHIDPDVAALEVYRPCPRERPEGRFRRSVNSERGETFDRHHRASDDDCAPRRHQRQSFLDREERALDVNAEIFVEMSFADLFERSECAAAGIRKKNIEPTFRLFDRVKHLIKIRETRDIAPNASDPISDLFHGGIKFGLPTTRDKNMRSLRDKAFSRGQTETAAASSN